MTYMQVSFSPKGIHPPSPMMHIAYSPYFSQIYQNSSPLIFILFGFPLLWPWCFYASCLKHTGRPCSVHIRRRFLKILPVL